MQKQKAVFLDRDGIINIDHGYVGHYHDFDYVEGVFDMIKHFVAQGFKPIIVTNQSGIARGYFTEADFLNLMKQVQDEFSDQGLPHIPVFYCPHHPEGNLSAYQVMCECRKPKPGMLLNAAKQYAIDLPNSIMIGDSWRDIEAGQAAGVKWCVYVSDKAPPLEADSSQVYLVNKLTEIPGSIE